MSTKDISRSAVEGGRYGYNKWLRNESHRHERARTKVWLDKIRFDEEVAEYEDPVPRNKVNKGFTDNLGPCYGWLASKCGQSWGDVRSKLAKTFDTRTLSAWHIVNQHMLPEVEGAGTTSDNLGRYQLQRFFIDDEGILRDRGSRRRTQRQAPADVLVAQVEAFLKGRKIMGMGYKKGPYWGHPGDPRWEPCTFKRWCKHKDAEHQSKDVTPQATVFMYTEGTHRTWRDSPHWRKFETTHLAPTWTMGKRLTEAEKTWWEALPHWLQYGETYSSL